MGNKSGGGGMHDYERPLVFGFGTGVTGFFSWFAEQLYAHGPSWSLVPPLGFAAASVVGTVVAALRARQELRHKDELHQIAVEAARRGLTTVDAAPMPPGLRAD